MEDRSSNLEGNFGGTLTISLSEFLQNKIEMVGAYWLGFNRGFKDDIWSFQSFAEAFRQFAEAFRQFAEAFRQFAEIRVSEGEKEKERKETRNVRVRNVPPKLEGLSAMV